MSESETRARSTAPVPETDLRSKLLQVVLEEEYLRNTVGKSERVGHTLDVSRFKTGSSALRAQRATGRCNDNAEKNGLFQGRRARDSVASVS